MDSLNITTSIALRYPISNWDLIWNNISQFHNPKERLIYLNTFIKSYQQETTLTCLKFSKIFPIVQIVG